MEVMGGRIAPRIKSVLIDLSGTLHIDDTVIPGAVGALNRLRETDLKLKFVTNTTKESKRLLHQRLAILGFSIGLHEIFTSLTAARDLVQKKNVRPHLLLDNSALEDFEDVNLENPNAVVVGLAPEKLNYEEMNRSFRLMIDGAPLIAIHTSRYYRRKDGLALGPGPFVKALEFSTDRKAEVVGKPEKAFFLSAIKDFHCLPEECVMIGDDARDDIGGAQDAGMSGILVKTGKYREGDENKINPEPYKTVENICCAVDLIISSLTE